MRKTKDIIISIATLFTSFSTLLCCALPALLISLGMGAVMAGLVSNVPQLIWLSNHKNELFIIAAIMLFISGYFTYKKNQSCPIDPIQAKACVGLKKFNKWVFWMSVILYLIGLFFAYLFELLI
ncbi:MAG: hypothetical protein ACJA02_000041 [Myxococcota bacterium]|jgi:hypothetical protein